MLAPRIIMFASAKAGSRDLEWEDGAAYAVGDPGVGPTRIAVADGATEAFGSRRWAAELARGFTMEETAPNDLDDVDALTRWFAMRQSAWTTQAPPPTTIFEEFKSASGSFATFLGCEVHRTETGSARWRAVALGDAVLFHVRGNQVVRQLPSLGDEDFGLHPHGAHTRPEALAQMAEDLVSGGDRLEPRDHLLLATDALAHWAVQRRHDRRTWDFLTRVSHPTQFQAFVDDRRASGELKNDDVTLLRLTLADAAPKYLVVCR